MNLRTVSAVEEERLVGDGGSRSAYLFVVIAADAPGRAPARICLDGVSRVDLGRGEALRRHGDRVEVGLDDQRVSQSHARLERRGGQWILVDQGSKNGSAVNGARVAEAALDDGAVIELGQTFLRFRAALPMSTAALPAGCGLATLLPELTEDFLRLAQVAPSRLPVVLLGESGAGKEVAAQAAHALSARRGALIAVNCGAIPANLVESQLFGHRRGAFSGALDDSPGLVRSASGGTLFLDEIGELPPPAQAALLRVIEEGEVLPLGAARAVPVDFRVIAATHRRLGALVAAGGFREDLHNRLRGFQLELPPLRERLEDLGLIVAELLRRGGGPVPLHPRVVRAMFAHGWPGNIRELGKTLDAARLLAGGGPIRPEHLPDGHLLGAATVDGGDARRREEIIALLREHDGNIAAVARACGKARTQVHRWLRRFQLRAEDYRR